MRIFKYEIPVEDYIELEMPEGAMILSVQSQFDKPCIWALVNSGLPKEKRKFRMIGTGHMITETLKELKFIGTFQLMKGALVFHLFEVK